MERKGGENSGETRLEIQGQDQEGEGGDEDNFNATRRRHGEILREERAKVDELAACGAQRSVMRRRAVVLEQPGPLSEMGRTL